ncbi:MAG: benzoate rane transport protein, partial [Solirubrobacteraceae bacterium]|nr:benzoate rane transport protein [Solirubrobacteraceae bacterium]
MRARSDLLAPVLAGCVTALVGFSGSFPVVLAGLRAAGADAGQAASGLLAASVAAGVVAILMSRRVRMPLAMAWSTPGAALLVSTGAPDGGFAAAVGAFLVCGALIVLTGLWGTLGRLIGAIPPALASAMLAGVLLPICLAPVRAVVEIPWVAAPVVLVWAALTRVSRQWAAPGAIVAAVIAVAIDGPGDLSGLSLLPRLEVVSPTFLPAAIVSIALPLFIVTMASQNIAGMGVLASFGYRPRLGPILTATGAATIAAAPFGSHAVNLASISAALAANPDAHPDPDRRWLAAAVAGAGLIALGLCAGIATALVAASPAILVEAVAGLALLGALAGALAAALADADR